jgi:hypothetical protein
MKLATDMINTDNLVVKTLGITFAVLCGIAVIIKMIKG